MQNLLVIAAGGAVGTICRYFMAGGVQRLVGPGFPLGTFSVNILGSFLFGLVAGILAERVTAPPEIRMALLTGFMGAFTTFSTFSFETMNLVRLGQWWAVLANAGGQLVLGLVAVGLGLALARVF